MAWIQAGASVVGGYLSSQSGGDSGSAQGPSSADMEKAQKMIVDYTNRVRRDIYELGPKAIKNMLAGKEGALGVLKEALPQQMESFRQGNMNAQETTAAGLPQQIAAQMGQELDLSGLQAKGIDSSTDWIAGLQMPDFETGMPTWTMPSLVEKSKANATGLEDALNDPNVSQVVKDFLTGQGETGIEGAGVASIGPGL